MKKSIYIFSDGKVKRQQNTLYFESETEKKYLPIENIEELFIFGEVTINKKLLEFLSQKKVILHFFNYYGFYVGTYYPREYNNSGYAILNQCKHYIDNEKRMKLAKLFITGSVSNILCVLKYYNKRRCDLNYHINKIENLFDNIILQSDISKLMGIEGNIREYYYKSFNYIIKKEDFYFDKRTKRPPKSNINALISFGNTLLYTVILGEIYKTHLDPRIGFLHETNFRQFTLHLDVSEIFKPIIVDRTIFSVLNRKMITKKHFRIYPNKVYLNKKGRIIFVEEFEKKLHSTIKIRQLKRNVSYKSIILKELYKIEKHLMDEEKYQPFVMFW